MVRSEQHAAIKRRPWRRALTLSLPTFVVCLVVGAAVLDRPHDAFVPYVPCLMFFERGAPVIVDIPELDSPELGRAVAEWLRPGEYEFRKDKLYVNHWVARDREMLMNYTQKAKLRVERDAQTREGGGS